MRRSVGIFERILHNRLDRDMGGRNVEDYKIKCQI